MKSLAKFTQLRPYNTLDYFAAKKLHFELRDFLYSRDKELSAYLSKVESDGIPACRENVKKYVAENSFLQRAQSATQIDALNLEIQDLDHAARKLTSIASISITSFLNDLQKRQFVLGALEGVKFVGDDADLHIASTYAIDLLSLYILPGMYPDYRRFLACWIKLAIILRESRSSLLTELAQKQTLIEEQINPKRDFPLWYRFFSGEILLPSEIQFRSVLDEPKTVETNLAGNPSPNLAQVVGETELYSAFTQVNTKIDGIISNKEAYNTIRNIKFEPVKEEERRPNVQIDALGAPKPLGKKPLEKKK